MFRTIQPTRRFVIVLTSAALAVTGLTVGGLATASTASASGSEMLGQVNASRADKGLPGYTWNSHLADVAGEQANRMANKTKLYHNPNLASDVGNYRWVGENVGYGPNSNSIENAFMNSAPHRANILDGNYTQIGIAQVRDDKGRLWVAQVFRQPSGSSSSSNASNSSSKKAAKKSSKPKATVRTHTTRARTTTARTTTSNATVPKKPAHTGTTRRAPTAVPAPTSTPAPTLEQRVSYATSTQNAAASTDPLADALAFAATMNAVGG